MSSPVTKRTKHTEEEGEGGGGAIYNKDVLCSIVGWLDDWDMCSLRLVCSTFARVIAESAGVWRHRFKRRWPVVWKVLERFNPLPLGSWLKHYQWLHLSYRPCVAHLQRVTKQACRDGNTGPMLRATEEFDAWCSLPGVIKRLKSVPEDYWAQGLIYTDIECKMQDEQGYRMRWEYKVNLTGSIITPVTGSEVEFETTYDWAYAGQDRDSNELTLRIGEVLIRFDFELDEDDVKKSMVKIAELLEIDEETNLSEFFDTIVCDYMLPEKYRPGNVEEAMSQMVEIAATVKSE